MARLRPRSCADCLPNALLTRPFQTNRSINMQRGVIGEFDGCDRKYELDSVVAYLYRLRIALNPIPKLIQIDEGVHSFIAKTVGSLLFWGRLTFLREPPSKCSQGQSCRHLLGRRFEQTFDADEILRP